ncbi:DUF6714 family protein [Pyxidicoccus xibeiensis]|uniref:DUF6714 family protein n=1 Tax=Pyxidicoccus xibeiensis TaxID=2906759 RepID=UPI0020A7E04F|nr:DUF6714 family protein [Pyxidicoccus xibeiensis]MCP3141853.1 hypothetical protein [Pyxidicoccus xibeiensis]
MPESDPHLLDLFSRAFTEPGLARGEGRHLLRPGDMPWEVFEATLAHFVERTMAETPGAETRRRLRDLLSDLHLRPSLFSDELMRGLGVHEARASVLRAIHEAFAPAPLVGRPLGEAVLDDEKAFREVPEAQLAQARATAETLDWRRVSDGEIERAFELNSVYLWLDDSARSFYLPAFRSYALHHPAGRCEGFTLLALLEPSPPDAMNRWSHAQRRAIARFFEFVAADQPWDSVVVRHRDALAAWRALIE